MVQSGDLSDIGNNFAYPYQIITYKMIIYSFSSNAIDKS